MEIEENYLSRFIEHTMIFISVTALLCFAVSLRDITFFEYIFLVICEFLFVVFMDINLTFKTSFWTHIRFCVLFEILIGVAVSFFREVINIYIFIPETIAQYFITAYFFKVYIQHEAFEEQCNKKKRGELETELFNNRFISEDFLKESNSFKAVMLGSVAVMVVLISVLNIAKIQISFLTYVFALVFIFSLFIHAQILNQYKKEIYYAFLGLEAIFAFRNLTLLLATALCVICLVVALALSSNYAILKPRYFSWILKFFKFESHSGPVDYTIPEIQQPELPPVEEFAKIYGQTQEESNTGLIIDLVLIGTILILFLYFLLKPLFTSSWKGFLAGQNISQVFTKIKLSFVTMLKNFLNLMKFKKNYTSTGSESFKDSVGEFIKASKKTKEKKAELDRLTRNFMDLIEWGESHNIKYTTNLAPAEYTALFKNQNATDAGNIFEKALYSSSLITQQEETEFKNKIKTVISA